MGILAKPKGSFFQKGENLPGAVGLRTGYGLGTASFLRLQIDTVFTHGILQVRSLGMLHVGAGHVKRAGEDIIKASVDAGAAVAIGNIMDFIASAAVAVAGNGA